MTYTTINLTNSSGIDDIIVYVTTAVPVFIPALLVFIWLTFSMLIYFGTRKFAGNADFFAGLSAAGLFTVMLSASLQLSLGILTATNIGVTIAIAILSFVFMMFKRSRD